MIFMVRSTTRSVIPISHSAAQHTSQELHFIFIYTEKSGKFSNVYSILNDFLPSQKKVFEDFPETVAEGAKSIYLIPKVSTNQKKN